MDSVRFFIQSFEYDLWANQQWLGALGKIRSIEKAQEVMEHILSAQGVWLERCGAWVPVQEDNLDMRTVFRIYSQAWIALVRAVDLNSVVSYVNSSGIRFNQPVGDIALHVVNHGTYHRGQLRGIAEMDGAEEFPKTDLILFLRERYN